MKGLIIGTSVILGIVVGIFPSISKPKPNWWKYFVSIIFLINLIMIFMPTLVANPNYANYLAVNSINEEIIIDTKETQLSTVNDTIWLSPIKYPILTDIKVSELKDNLIKLQFDSQNKAFTLLSIEHASPIPLQYPLIVELKERIKIMVLHVPVAWTAVLAYLFGMIFAIMYLRTRNYKYDIYASSAAGVGVILTILATVTGMIWAKFNWGSYWNWDPRETSIFILLLIYFAYFALRHSVENPETRSRLSAVYSIIAFVTVPFFIFILPRISSGLHPGASGEGTAGPVLGGGTEMLNPNLGITFGFSMFCFTLLFFWLFNLKIRSEILNNKL